LVWGQRAAALVWIKTLEDGAIDVASLEIETQKQVAATIKGAMEFVDPECMPPSTNRGMAPLPRQVAEGKIAALGAGAPDAQGARRGVTR
jgi:5-methyltetrahydropteroyltriglutamate--homocysteine methyltransferase